LCSKLIFEQNKMNKIQTISDIYAIDKIIAIDPGKSGGIAIWTPNELQVIKMPETTKQFSDIIIGEKKKTPNLIVAMEKVQLRDDDNIPGKQYRIAKMMKNYNSLIAAVEIADIALWNIYPITWQNGLYFKHKGFSKEDRKNAYKEFAQKTFTDIRATLWNADALCILEYSKRQVSKNFAWVLKQLPQNMLYNIRIANAI